MKKSRKEKAKLLLRIKSYDNIIKGSIYEMKRYCGKKNCKCIKENSPHKSLFLSFKYEGKTNLIPIKKNQIPFIRKRIKDYKQLKKAIDKLAKINSDLLRYE